MPDVHPNFATSTVATAPSPASSGPSLVVTSGEGARFATTPPFNAVVCPAGSDPTSSNAEIVRITNRSTDTLTITRAQEGTAARTILVGDRIFVAATQKTFTDNETDIAAKLSLTDRRIFDISGMRKGFLAYDDFFGVTGASGNPYALGTAGSGAASGQQAISATNRPGVTRPSTGTTNTGRVSLVTATTGVALGAGAAVFETAINVTALSTVTERYALVIGFLDTAGLINQTDAVAFVYDEGGVMTGGGASANWQAHTASNTSRTFTASSTAVSAGSWVTLRVEVNAAGSSSTFYIDGSLVATVATNIPTGTARAVGFGMTIIKSIGTTASTVDLDYMAAAVDFTTPRAT